MKRLLFKYQSLSDQARYGNWPISLVILVAGLALTIVSTAWLKEDVEAQAKHELALISNELKTRIEQRLNAHALMLRNGASFFAASDTVTREEWKVYMRNSRLERILPGVEGVGYSYIVPKDQLPYHIQKVREEGFPDYTIKPEGERDIYTSILYLEPFTGRNLRAFGYDMFSEPVRRNAMERARDNDNAALSGKVTLVQETDENPQAGTLMYVPVYRNGMRAFTIEERRAAIIGWVYSPYRMDDLMHGILGRWDSTEYNRIRLQIYEDQSLTGDCLLFDTQATSSRVAHKQPRAFTYTIPLVFNDKKWNLSFSQPKRMIGFFNSKVIIVFGAGVLISFLLFALFLALSKAKSRLLISERLAGQLRESEEKYRALIENATEGIYVVQDGRVAFANKACEGITGIPVNEMTGLPIKEFLDTAETERLYRHHDDLIAGTTHSLHEIFPIFNRKEERRWLLINSVQINWNGSPATLNLATDVTRRKEDEEEISRKHEELERLNATKDKFFSIIAHDLRSPFNSVLGLADILMQDLPDMDTDQVKHMVEIIHKAVNNLYRLLQNLLQWAQIQNGTIPYDPRLLHLRKIVNEGIDIVRESALMKDIELTNYIPEHIRVVADSNMLQTVIRNLVSNAVKFTPKGGDVAVSAMLTKDNNAQISVKDTGIGMSQAMIQNLFRIDVKTNRMGTDKEPSNGLGLLLCKEFVEKNGGRIWVESEVGKGTTFHFTIPEQT
ncbi:MAG: CHASE domain-containing protein [Verrucomicrobia bacterium]|nr:CHASE domain-containing protein [Prolixibacteraceae bacterium]